MNAKEVKKIKELVLAAENLIESLLSEPLYKVPNYINKLTNEIIKIKKLFKF